MRKIIRNVVVLGGAATPWYLSGTLSTIPYIAVYQAAGASVANETAARRNLVNPGTYDLTEVVAGGSWDAVNGFVNRRLTTGIIVTPTLGAMVKFTGLASSDQINFGSSETNRLFGWILNPFTGANAVWYYRGQSVSSVGGEYAAGSGALNNRYAYKDGSPVGAQFLVMGGDGTYTLYLGGCHNAGATTWVNQNIQAAAFWSAAITDAQVLALHNAMLALP